MLIGDDEEKLFAEVSQQTAKHFIELVKSMAEANDGKDKVRAIGFLNGLARTAGIVLSGLPDHLRQGVVTTFIAVTVETMKLESPITDGVTQQQPEENNGPATA